MFFFFFFLSKRANQQKRRFDQFGMKGMDENTTTAVVG